MTHGIFLGYHSKALKISSSHQPNSFYWDQWISAKKKEHTRFRSAVMLGLKIEIYNKRGSEKPEEPVFQAKKTLNSGKGQQTNQKYRNLVNSDRQMQRLELKVNLERLTVRLGLTVI